MRPLLETLEPRLLLDSVLQGDPLGGAADPPVSAAAPGTTYLLFENWGGTWADAEKDDTDPGDPDDDNLCWAATATNMLAASGSLLCVAGSAGFWSGSQLAGFPLLLLNLGDVLGKSGDLRIQLADALIKALEFER